MKEGGKKTFFATRKRIDAALAQSEKVVHATKEVCLVTMKTMKNVIEEFQGAQEIGVPVGMEVRALACTFGCCFNLVVLVVLPLL